MDCVQGITRTSTTRRSVLVCVDEAPIGKFFLSVAAFVVKHRYGPGGKHWPGSKTKR